MRLDWPRICFQSKHITVEGRQRMVKDTFAFALVTAGLLSVLIGFWGIYITATLVGYLDESRVLFWNVILFAALIAAGSLAIGYVVGKRYP